MKADSAFFDLAAGGIDGVEVNFKGVVGELKPGAHLLALSPIATHHSNTIGIEDAGMEIRDTVVWVFDSGGQTPEMLMVTVARKPLEGTVAANVLAHGTGGLNVDGCRVGAEARPVMVRTETVVSATSMSGQSTGATSSGELTTSGRWPANLIHDGSDEVVGLFPQTASGKDKNPPKVSSSGWTGNGVRTEDTNYGDSGSAARFFYTAPCLNDLLKYLLKLITPPGGTVLTNCDNTLVQSAYLSVKYDED